MLEAFRSDVFDLDTPPLWTDAEIFRYMDDAQKMFCRLTEGIEDGRTPAITQFVLAPLQEWIELSPLILKIRSARYNRRAVDLIPFEHVADSYDRRSRGDHQFVYGYGLDGWHGSRGLVIGESKNALRIAPRVPATFLDPLVPDTVELVVFRLPLKKITDSDQRLEIDDQHLEALLIWMKHRAYAKQDADTFDPRKSEDAKREFQEYCTKAKAEQGRLRHPAGTTMYGGL